MNTSTIREIGGEIAAEINVRQRNPSDSLAKMDWQHAEEIVDIVMGVLARGEEKVSGRRKGGRRKGVRMIFANREKKRCQDDFCKPINSS